MRVLAWLALLAPAIWLLQPALAPVHVEGFSASIVALGLHVADGSIRNFMPFAALSTDYFGLTKLGAVLSVAALSPVLGGEAAMRLLMHAGLLISLACSAWLVRRWTGARWWTIAAVLLLLPAAFETAFYFNDNLPAAALLFAGLALIEAGKTKWTTVGAGVLIGGAVSFRLDVAAVALLATPLIVWDRRSWRGMVMTSCIAGATALAVVFTIFGSIGTTPFDALRAGTVAVSLWDRPFAAATQVNQFLYFCGLPCLLFAALGVVQLAREREWQRLALLTGVPVAFNIVLMGSLWESRQFLVLAPFISSLAALGGEATLREFKEGGRVFPLVLAAVTLLILTGPIRGLVVSDGPHEHVGRFAGIARWQDWQAQVRQDFARIDQLVAGAPRPGPLIVLTNGWNDDRYLHLRLLESGFKPFPLPPSCETLGVGFRKSDAEGDVSVVQLTLQIPFVHNASQFQSRRLAEGARPCIAAFPGARLAFLAEQAQLTALLRIRPNVREASPWLRDLSMSPIVAVPLDASELPVLEDGYRRTVMPSRGPPSMEAAQAAVGSQTAFSR